MFTDVTPPPPPAAISPPGAGRSRLQDADTDDTAGKGDDEDKRGGVAKCDTGAGLLLQVKKEGYDMGDVIDFSKAVMVHVDEEDKRFEMLPISDSQNGDLVKTEHIAGRAQAK